MSNPLQFQCRMYEAKYPEVDDFVMVNVRACCFLFGVCLYWKSGLFNMSLIMDYI
ncbi:22134_t:CDS:1, partial [Racocetra persica]